MRRTKVIASLMLMVFCAGIINVSCSNRQAQQSAEVADENRAEWFKEARFGMFVHWGLYSILGGSYGGHTLPDKSLPNGNHWYSEWAQMRLEIPKDEYQKLVKEFNPVNFDADQWVREVSLAGMKYIVLTSKHHDGFALWDSEVSDYDLGASPCKRDLLGELAEACEKYDVRLGFYYSHWQDWEHEGGAQPVWPGKVAPSDEMFEKYWQEKCLPQVKELLVRYQPDMLWFDTWNSTCKDQITLERRDELIDLIREVKPNCLINGRICAYDPGDRVDYLSAGDNRHPEKNLGRPWQTPATMNHTWAWHAGDFNWKDSGRMIKLLATNVSLGGNYLLNIGPYADGRIPAPSLRRMREIGGWLVANGESIYGASPLDEITPPVWGRLTARTENNQKIVYAHVMDWGEGTLEIPQELGKAKSASVLETGQEVDLIDGAAFVKPKGALDPNVATIKLVF
ncbi:MAG: alpha-L-fucosidase [Mangrovibacterium sp.]